MERFAWVRTANREQIILFFRWNYIFLKKMNGKRNWQRKKEIPEIRYFVDITADQILDS